MNDLGFLMPYTDMEKGISFKGAYVFNSASKYLLLGTNGNILLINEKLYMEIAMRQLSEQLAVKLIQRDLAAINGEKNNIYCYEKESIHPTFFMIDLTNKCNMRCRYCLRDDDTKMPTRVMKEETLMKICDYISRYCIENKLNNIIIQPWGGEPLLEKNKIFMIQDRMKKNGIDVKISIETNGILLSPSVIRELYDRNIAVSVSIDGYADVHDSQRLLRNSEASHRLVEASIIELQKLYGNDVSIIATITKNSVNAVQEIIEYFANDLKLHNIKMNYVHKSSFHENEEMCLTADEIAMCSSEIFDKILKLRKQGVEIYDYNIWMKSANILANRKQDVCISQGCQGGRMMITFDVEGKIFPCDVTDYPDECMGTIYDDSDLTELINKAIVSKPYFEKKESTECLNCPWYAYCGGGCTVHVKCAEGNSGEIDMIECSVNKAIYPKIVRLILEDAEGMNKLFGCSLLDEGE